MLHGGADAGIPKDAAKRIADEAGDFAECGRCMLDSLPVDTALISL